MEMKQLDYAKAAGFVKAATSSGFDTLQAVALCKLAFTEEAMEALKNPLQSALHPGLLGQDSGTRDAVMNPHFQDYGDNRLVDSLKQRFKDTPADHFLTAGKDAWKLVGLGTGGLGLAYLLGANQKKREKEQKVQYPMKVTYDGQQ
jgi:hypothetical protein